MSKLDDVSWHLNAAGIPEDTAEVRAALHIGLFTAWAIQCDGWKGLDGPEAEPTDQVRSRQMTGTRFLLDYCDGKLFAEMLTPEMASFAERYYPGKYLRAYAKLLRKRGLREYQVPDDWQLFDDLAIELQAAHSAKEQRKWWQFW